MSISRMISVSSQLGAKPAITPNNTPSVVAMVTTITPMKNENRAP